MKKIFIRVISVGIFLILFIPSASSEISTGQSFSSYSKMISMDFQDANMKDVLKIFSQQSALNFIASEEVQDRTVTLYLDNVPVEEALERLLTANNLTYEKQEGSNIFIVKELAEGLQTVTKIFFLKYASVSSSRLKSEISSGLVRKTEFEGSSSEGGAAGTGGDTASAVAAEVTNIKKIVENFLSKEGKVIEDARTNSLIITDKPEQFSIIEKTIALLDVPTPQVVIEVEMLDVSKDLVDKMGVNWDATPTDSSLTFSGASRQTKFPLDGGYIGDSTGVVTSKTFTMGTISAAGLDIALDFISTDTGTKYLARPRILTLNNETAEIKIVTDEAIGLKQTVSQEGIQSTEEAERAETGVALRVTPQVNTETGEITMFVEPTVSEASTSSLGSAYKDPERRQTKSVLRIKDGETIVIGGLIRTRGTEVITKVPFLGDIPLLGAAFRHKNKSKDEDRELIIFITPHIVKEQKITSASSKINHILPFSREQDLPQQKMAEVDNALSRFEKKNR
ncbi:MAG: hypothetical protein FJZ10_05900 [Candidatus Omnitrophica bacterium]|nr:hypothetical protein [Candidatus Omnitrophota bacterium]